MTDTKVRTITQQQENDLLEVKEYVIEESHKMLDKQEFKSAIASTGIRFHSGLIAYVTNYHGSSTKMYKIRASLATTGKLTVEQCRIAYNILCVQLENGTVALRTDGASLPLITDPDADAPDLSEPEPVSGQSGELPATESPVTESPVTESDPIIPARDAKPVISSTKTMFNVASIPDGRYAFFDVKERQDWIFMEVKTIKRNTIRSKHFETGKFIKGRETLKAGTIEVRELRGDTRRLAGYQKPGHGYEGEFIPELIAIADAPAPWSQLYGRMIGHCGICGKRLTDEESRDRTLGPDCYSQWGDEYYDTWNRDKMLEEAEEKRAAKLAAKAAVDASGNAA